MRLLAAFGLFFLLPGCERDERDSEAFAQPQTIVESSMSHAAATGDAPDSDPAEFPKSHSVRLREQLASRDCKSVVGAYGRYLQMLNIDLASSAWNNSSAGKSYLRELIEGYKVPRLTVDKVDTEGAAGSLYCTAEVTLFDDGNDLHAPRKGTIFLKRVNDVPGATPEQLRWTIRSSTFIEPMERSGRGEPA